MLYQMQLGELPPANKKRKPAYPWSVIDKNYQWAAIDENGELHLFMKEPYIATFDDGSTGEWLVDAGLRPDCINANFLVFDRGDLPWTETKMKRPEGY